MDASTDLANTAKRIVWGKFLNLGQVCIAPDYILCSKVRRGRVWGAREGI